MAGEPHETSHAPLASERYRILAQRYRDLARELVDRLPDSGILAEGPRDRVDEFLGDAQRSTRAKT